MGAYGVRKKSFETSVSASFISGLPPPCSCVQSANSMSGRGSVPSPTSTRCADTSVAAHGTSPGPYHHSARRPHFPWPGPAPDPEFPVVPVVLDHGILPHQGASDPGWRRFLIVTPGGVVAAV